MKTRQLGKDGPQLTIIGLGTWAIGGPWDWGWGPQKDEDSIAAIRESLEQGINWIDTAPVYGLGHAEEVVAQALEGYKREEVFIATKCGLVWDDRGRVDRNLHPESIRREIEASLKRLKTDYVDLYQHHWPDQKTPVEESWAVMVRLQEEGKVRYIGVCNYDVPLLKRCSAIAPVQSLQPPYSMVKRDIEKEILPYCHEHQIGVVAYSPLQTGLLTGKVSKERLAPDDWRHKSEFFKEPKYSRVQKLVEQLRPIAERKNITLAQLAIAWVVSQTGVTSAIVGARNAQQARENAAAAEVELTPADLQEIDALLADFRP